MSVGSSKNPVLKCTQSNIEQSGKAEAIFVVGQTIIEYSQKNVPRHFLKIRKTKGQICRRLERQKIKS